MGGKALKVFLLLSLVSLLADITYEGARSVSGSFLSYLGAPVVATSILALGELFSHVFRLLGGALAFRLASPRAYWAIVFAGYGLNVSVPLLALVGDWRLALALYLAERAGKGLRTPVRDSLIAEVSKSMGRGRAFAVHELLDQVGGVAGPVAVALAIEKSGGSYGLAFGALALPFAASMAALYLAWLAYGSVSRRELGEETAGASEGALARAAAIALFTLLLAAGFLHWSHASFRLREMGLADSTIAWLYAVAMLADALAAVPLGILFDRFGLKSMALMPVLVSLSSLSFVSSDPLVFAATWGVAMGSIETMLKAGVASLGGARERPLLYAVSYVSMGAGWALGNALMSVAGVSLYYVAAVEIACLLALAAILKRAPATS